MLDKSSLTYSFQKRAIGQSSERALISLERSQKLDLLLHLLTNLHRPLLVSGPKGIGKTYLLHILQATKQEQWRIFIQSGSANLSFETIINNLNRFLNLNIVKYGFDLASLRNFCDNQKVVLIIDDADELVPGLLGELIDFSDSLPGMRLVFAMTYEQFQIKSPTDKAIENCHFIELPPLNLRQCGEFLQNLSLQPNTNVTFNAVTESLVEELYRETQGIPGKILAEIPNFDQYQNRKISRISLWLGIGLICLMTGLIITKLLPSAGNYQQTNSRKNIEFKPESVSAAPISETSKLSKDQTDILSARIEDNQIPKNSAQTVVVNHKINQLTEANQTIIVPTKVEPQLSNPAAASIKTLPLIIEPVNKSVPQSKPESPDAKKSLPIEIAAEVISQKTSKTTTEDNNSETSNLDWIMSQPVDNYTLQIMVLSNKAAVTRFLKKHVKFSDQLKYYTIEQNGQEKYVLIYGTFSTMAEAKALKATLPDEFNRGLEKKFKFIQKESRH